MKRSLFMLMDRYPDEGEPFQETLTFTLEHARMADALGLRRVLADGAPLSPARRSQPGRPSRRNRRRD